MDDFARRLRRPLRERDLDPVLLGQRLHLLLERLRHATSLARLDPRRQRLRPFARYNLDERDHDLRRAASERRQGGSSSRCSCSRRTAFAYLRTLCSATGAPRDGGRSRGRRVASAPSRRSRGSTRSRRRTATTRPVSPCSGSVAGREAPCHRTGTNSRTAVLELTKHGEATPSRGCLLLTRSGSRLARTLARTGSNPRRRAGSSSGS